jgi:DNA-binding MarR family transcriptional regulator
VLSRSDDRRRHTVLLTAAGRRKLMRGAEAQRAGEDELLARLDPAQRVHLRALLLELDGEGCAAEPREC